MFKMIQSVKRGIKREDLKEDLRKLGINLVTAGMVGLYITHLNSVALLPKLGSFCTITLGTLISIIGLYNRKE